MIAFINFDTLRDKPNSKGRDRTNITSTSNYLDHQWELHKVGELEGRENTMDGFLRTADFLAKVDSPLYKM